MSYINWGLAQGNNALASFGQGMQLGNYISQKREEKERDSALAAYAADPSETNFAGLAKAAPAYAIKERERMEARQAQQQENQLTQRALGGDTEALQQLATVNFDKWKTLDGQQRQALTQEAEVYGNAALDVLNLPPQERPQAVMAYANRLGSEEIAGLANLPPQELEAALRAQVAESGMIKELQAMERPNYMAIPQGGTLVDTRNPQAVQQFGQGGGAQPIPKQVGDATYYQNPETGEWFDNPQEAMGGSGGNAGGGF